MDEAAPNPQCPGCQALLKRVGHLEREVEKLTVLAQELRSRLDQNSSNSSRPPSSDSPSQRANRPSRPPSGRKPGGQTGHEAHVRAFLPADQVTRHERRDPRHCRRCAAFLSGAGALEPLRRQVVEIPALVLDVTECQGTSSLAQLAQLEGFGITNKGLRRSDCSRARVVGSFRALSLW